MSSAAPMDQLGKVVTWLYEKSKPPIDSLEVMTTRICRAFRIDQRPDYPRAPESAEEPAAEMLGRVCRAGQKLKLILDTVVLAKKSVSRMPKFLQSYEVSLELPEYGHHLSEEKLRGVFAKLLYAFLLKMWTPLRFSEDLVYKLSVYVVGEGDLPTGSTPPATANDISLHVLDQLKRLESILSRIEIFVLTKHHQPLPMLIEQFLALRSRFMRAQMAEAQYREEKTRLLEMLVDSNLKKFTPTPFFLLASPDDSARASVSPQMMLDKSLDQMVRESLDTNKAGSAKLTIDDLMSLAEKPLDRKKDAPSTTINYRNTIQISSLPQQQQRSGDTGSGSGSGRDMSTPASQVATKGARTRNTVQFDTGNKSPRMRKTVQLEKKDWDSTDALASPVSAVEDIKPSIGVALEPQQVAKLQELEQLKNDASLKVSAVGRENAVKILETKTGQIKLAVEFCSAFVYANQSLFITVSMQNSAKGCVVDGIELTLRDPDFKRVLQQPNCVDQFVRRNKKSSLPFPLKSPDTAEITFGLHLPYLEPVVQRSRYTLAFSPFGKKIKKDSFNLSIPLAVIRAAKLHEHIPSQIFFSPLAVIQKRENSVVPKVLKECIKYFEHRDECKHCFSFEEMTPAEEENYLRLKEDYNFGRGNLLDSPYPKVVAKLFSVFFLTLPESIAPSPTWPRFKGAIEEKDELKRISEMQKALSSLPKDRHTILREFLRFIQFMQRKDAFLSPDFLAPVIVRPPDRAADALAISEGSQASAIMTLLVKMSPI